MKTRLGELRRKNRISQRELAETLHISQTSVSKYERGAAEPDLTMTLEMARYFGVTVDYFLYNTDSQR